MIDRPGIAASTATESIDDQRLLRRWLIVFILVGLLWRLVRFSLALPIWGDEAMLGLNVYPKAR